MTERQRILACLNYQKYDRLPIIHFGFWWETLQKWQQEGHLTAEDLADGGSAAARSKMGFDLEWTCCTGLGTSLMPGFETKVIERMPDGSRKVQNGEGVIVLEVDGAVSIQSEIDHLLKGRKEWEEHYLPRLQFSESRIPNCDKFKTDEHDDLRGLHIGSLFGYIRNWVGVVGSAYIYADDEPLFDEMIDTVGNLHYRCTEAMLSRGTKFDFAHYWEDICFKTGPLINPVVFAEKVGPHYRRINDLLRQHGVEIVSLDCDGQIDSLIPTWLGNGVNTMFPIEVGTWNASIQPWREQYGKAIRGVGGMNKVAFSRDRAAIDTEIERLRPLVDLGGFIPCPDHRIPPDAKWDLVCYYTDRMRKVFS